MDINNEIRELLFEHDYVSIPELGAFIANYEPSVYSAEQNTFSPPARKISFNSVLKHDDGLLITSVMKKLNVTSGKAKELVQQYVTGIKNQLVAEHQFNIDGVGSFTLSEENKFVFEPSVENFYTESYGFETLYNFNNANFTYLDKNFVSDYSDFDPDAIESMNLNYSTTVHRKSFFTKILYASPVVLLLAGLLTVVMLSPKPEERAKSSFNPLDYVNSAQKWLGKKEQVAPVAEPQTVTLPPIVKKTKKYLLVGEFKSQEIANKFYNKLVLNDLEPEINVENEKYQLIIEVENEQQLAAVSQKLEQLIGKKGVLMAN